MNCPNAHGDDNAATIITVRLYARKHTLFFCMVTSVCVPFAVALFAQAKPHTLQQTIATQ